MINSNTFFLEEIKQQKTAFGKAVQLPKIDKRSLWFFFCVAPLAVMTGWSVVAVCLTGDWAWQLPMGLLFSFVGSMSAMISTVLRS